MTEEEKIERVARAICRVATAEDSDYDRGGYTIDAWVDNFWAEWKPEARAAITAMEGERQSHHAASPSQHIRDVSNMVHLTALASFAKEVIEMTLASAGVGGEDVYEVAHRLGLVDRDLKRNQRIVPWLSRIQKEGGGSGADASAPIATGNNGWRPIAEAPKDGSEILAFLEDGEGCDLIKWDEHGWKGPGWVQALGQWSVFPTHFMPLPPPPIPDTEKNDG